ncbi:MAG: hypothetical protein JWM28_2558 [Chitinophagaceae bacterium]|nr:hypothetical protein [Chitinophagaceae bacterium]
MVKRSLIIPALVFLLPLIINAQQEEDLIKWSAGRKLKWQDYLAAPDSRSGAAASTSTQIGFEYHIRDSNPTYVITCKFSKAKSWGRYKNDYILSHEQGHFDIAEIFTRKFVKALREYSFDKNTYRNDLRKIYSDVMKEKERFQQDYDGETDYSRIKPKQEEWLKKIEKMLEQSKEFSNYNDQ